MPPENRRRRQAKAGPDMSTWTPAEREAHLLQKRLDTPVAEMELSVRMINTLEEYDVIMARDLISQTYETLMRMKNFGEKSLTEVRAAVVALGLPAPDWKKPKAAPRPRQPKKTGDGGVLEMW